MDATSVCAALPGIMAGLELTRSEGVRNFRGIVSPQQARNIWKMVNEGSYGRALEVSQGMFAPSER
jgi:hypothetical protein